MHFTEQKLQDLEKRKGINLINSITGIKPANLIGSCSEDGLSNLAIFTSVFHMGSNPPLIGMLVRPEGEVRRHTLENIRKTGHFTINHISKEMIVPAHYTSAKWPSDVSEFDSCQYTEEYIEDFRAPFVKESNMKIGLSLSNEMTMKQNGTILVIGQIRHLIIEDSNSILDNGYLDLEKSGAVGVSGLNSYYTLKKIIDLPYARPK